MPTAALLPCPVEIVSVDADPARGLLASTLKPEGMKGQELFAHLCKLRNCAATSAAVGVSRI